ncbi:MAG TPA: N-acetylmuramoyl-L-alanine amidase [Flavilitoribacter sp.]|nr:N-acetylmuramoyl-L-alanine amidase [Flavilitoribacter sp.]
MALGSGKFSDPVPNPEGTYRIKTVVVDAGHGGHDPGCLGGHYKEKNIALAIAKAVAEQMNNRYPGIKVILTRDDDTFIPLYERAAIANRNNADLFISIHCNYMPGSKATKGTETYVMGLHTAEHNLDVAKRENESIFLEENYEKNYDWDPNSPEGHIMLSMYQNAYLEQSILLASKIEGKFGGAERKSRGVKQAGFVVLKETTMPSILVEAGFLSNTTEEAFLNTPEGQATIAGSIVDAFGEYKMEMEGGGDAPLATSAPVRTEQRVVNRSPELNITNRAAAQPASNRAVIGAAKPSAVNVQPVETKPTPSYSAQPPQKERMIIPMQNQAQPAPQTVAMPNDYERPVAVNAVIKSGLPGANQEIRFCVQLAASPKPLDTNTPKWKQIKYLVEMVREDNLFKYQARNFDDHLQAFNARLELQKQGFSDAFIVAYKNGNKIPVEQAKKELGID